jgi:hypothetical protein
VPEAVGYQDRCWWRSGQEETAMCQFFGYKICLSDGLETTNDVKYEMIGNLMNPGHLVDIIQETGGRIRMLGWLLG